MEKKEAMKILKDFYDKSALFSIRTALDTVIPELAESEDEDERIRKDIVEAVEFHKSFSQIRKEYIYAWLEKQGKNNMGISEATKKKLEDNLNKALEKETPESCNEFLDEQGEQKPTIEMITPEESLGIDSKTYNKIVDECIYGEQKPAEWSEKDEKLYNDAISLAYEVDDKELECWFMGIKERIKPKPKWSKKDSSMAFTLMRDIEQVSFISKEGKDERIKWLNSLCDTIRPQNTWKPSDEQIEAMQKALVDLCGKDEHNIITGLYYDLKKLKE